MEILLLSQESGSSILKECLKEYISTTRAVHLWFHGAHNVTRGTGFSGDHVNLYGQIYHEIQEDIDGLIEKAVGLTNDEGLACPASITIRAGEILADYPSPVGLSSLSIATCGCQLLEAYLKFLKMIFETLEDSDDLSLGLNDYIMSHSNKYESFIYLLQQREKVELED